MTNVQNSQEALEFLVTAFIISELYSLEYAHLMTFNVTEEVKDTLEKEFIDKIKDNALEEINKFFTENKVYEVVLTGQNCDMVVFNIIKYSNAKATHENHPFANTKAYTLKDFLPK